MTLQKIAEGRTAEVFSLGDGKVVKLYWQRYPSENIQREVKKCDFAFKQGLPTPQAIDLIQLNGRQGIVFEECTGSSMGKRLQNHPNDVEPMAKLLADLHIKIHECSGEELPSIFDHTRKNIDQAQMLDDTVKGLLKAQLGNMPNGQNMCHGDFHPDNVLLTDDGPVIIDWVDATMGPPVADVVRTILLIRYCNLPSEPKEVAVFVKMTTALLETYKAVYLGQYSFSEESIDLWAPILAGARLSENAIDWTFERELVSLINRTQCAT